MLGSEYCTSTYRDTLPGRSRALPFVISGVWDLGVEFKVRVKGQGLALGLVWDSFDIGEADPKHKRDPYPQPPPT